MADMNAFSCSVPVPKNHRGSYSPFNLKDGEKRRTNLVQKCVLTMILFDSTFGREKFIRTVLN